MYKKILIFAVFFTLSSVSVFAQSIASNTSNGDDDPITLPDVSTVISGGAPKAGKSAIPDYSKIIPKIETSEIVPQMPDPTNNAGNGISGSDGNSGNFSSKNATEKTVYVEGSAGLGIPGFFTGNFSIYRQTGANPFKINFGHESLTGYSWKSLSSGYFDKNTYIEAEKIFSTEKTKWILSGKYNSVDDGLQSNCANISDVTKDEMGLLAAFSANLPKNVSLKTQLDGSWYKRYGNITGNPILLDFEKGVNIIYLNPNFKIGFAPSKFYCAFDVDYKFEYDAVNSFDDRNANRVDFGLGLGWKNDLLNIFADVDAVLGNALNDNSVVVPFDVGADFSFTTGLSTRLMKISVLGGMDSFLPTVSSLEKAYKFSALNIIPQETSDWFGKLSFYMPIKDLVSVSFAGEFRKTAFDNGTFHPKYEKLSNIVSLNDGLKDFVSGIVFGPVIYTKSFFSNGQYFYIADDMTQFKTDLGLQFNFGIATLLAFWKSNWIDVLPGKNPNEAGLSVSIKDKKARVLFDSSFAIPFGNDVDGAPLIDFELSFKLSNAVRLAVSANDVVKLISGETRVYEGEYIQRSGYAAILAKFFF